MLFENFCLRSVKELIDSSKKVDSEVLFKDKQPKRIV